MLVTPGAYAGITVRLIEEAGFAVLHMTGAGTSAAFGLPDYGLLTMTEMVGNADLKHNHRHPTPLFDASVRDSFRRFGVDERGALRKGLRDETPRDEIPAEAAE